MFYTISNYIVAVIISFNISLLYLTIKGYSKTMAKIISLEYQVLVLIIVFILFHDHLDQYNTLLLLLVAPLVLLEELIIYIIKTK